jgi:hypothetical protein
MIQNQQVLDAALRLYANTTESFAIGFDAAALESVTTENDGRQLIGYWVSAKVFVPAAAVAVTVECSAAVAAGGIDPNAQEGADSNPIASEAST